jgi:hypothetical protein
MSIIDFKSKQKLTRAEQIARLNPEMSRDQIARQLGIKPEIIIMPVTRKASLVDWVLFFATFAVMGALLGWGLTL